MSSQKAVTAYFSRNHLLPFGFAEQCIALCVLIIVSYTQCFKSRTQAKTEEYYLLWQTAVSPYW